MEVLQTSALPLGDGAGRNWGSKLTWNVRPRLSTRPTATRRREEGRKHNKKRNKKKNERGGAPGAQTQMRGVKRAPRPPSTEAHQEGPQGPTFQAWCAE